MKIKESVRQRLECNKGYAIIMYSLDVSFTTARVYIKNNTDDLTKAAAIAAICKEYDLTQEEILETEEVEKA